VDQAVADHDLDLSKSFMVGDKITDVELAHQIGATGVMVKTGYGRGELEYYSHTWKVQPDYIAEDLAEAIDWILAQIKERG
jgi:D-glycero-D-manno-heptose 1,7-bisphosphate phosphatase